MIYCKYCKIVFLLLFTILLSAQSAQKDLKNLSYEELKKLYKNNAKDKSKQLVYANAFLTRANKQNSSIHKARGWYLLSLLYDGEKAIHYLDSTIYYSKNLNDARYPAYAFSRKAYELKYQSKYKEAIDNFLMAENLAKKNNTDFYYDVKYSIAVLRSEELGEVDEALKLYRECFNYYKEKDVKNLEYSYAYQDVLFGLADAYKALKQSDSATYFNRLGYNESKFTKDYEYNALFVLNEGANLVDKKLYKIAIDSINKALPKMIFYKNTENTLASYYYLGKAYEGLDKKNRAVENFIKVDSIYNKRKRITPEFTSGYLYLISYFKNKKDKENQLRYLTKYMHIDSILQNNYKVLTKKLQKEYDTPNLFLEKENLISSLKTDKTKSYWRSGLLLLILIGVSWFSFYQYRLKKEYRSRFEAVINETSIENSIEDNNNKRIEKTKQNNHKKEDIGIAEELVNEIIEKLTNFEKEKAYLNATITIQSLAANFETNNKYLSKIINTYKNKTFIKYINDLRIESAIDTLKNDSKLRKYTIQALALEFGFNSAESFSAAFYKKTAIKPTYFIKEFEESKKYIT